MAYHLQCYAVKRETKVLGVDVYLTSPDLEAVRNGKANPIEDIGYSRFVMTLVDKSGDVTIFPFGNIPACEISYIKSMKDIALQQKVLQPPGAELPDRDTAEGYSATFQFGRNAGKTVVDVLCDPQLGISALLREKEFLRTKVDRFPRNQLMIDEICRLEKELTEGTFDPKAVQARPLGGNLIVLYEQNFKYLNSKKDVKGHPLVYAIKMTFNPLRRYSWEVTIKNGFAPVQTKPNGGTSVVGTEISNVTQSSLRMMDVEFCSMIDKMYDCYRDFSTCSFRRQYELAKELVREDMARNSA